MPHRFALLAIAPGLLVTPIVAATSASMIPHLVHENGRHALIVDGAPFLLLGAQCHNSSAWPATLPEVWPAVTALGANTLEIPVYWEQFEPEPGRFDTSSVDLILEQARAHHVRLVLLWFATWKNGSPNYAPPWVKAQPAKFPRVVTRDGRLVNSLSPHAAATLEADRHAFRMLMRHLRENDPQHTVIMVQPENEPGTWGSVRDFSPAAQKLFESPVPEEALRAMHRADQAGANWAEAFGAEADEFFHAWSVARFIGQVAAAGKEEYPLPMYVNAALRDPLAPPPATDYESGGPTDNVLALWQAAAPAIDLLAPDIYLPDIERYRRVCELYARADNPLFIPETANHPGYARYLFTALGHGAIGWAPFGIDHTGYDNFPLGSPTTPEALAPFALNYGIVGPMQRTIARLNLAGRVRATSEEKGVPVQTLEFPEWKAIVTFGAPSFGFARDAAGNPEPVGGALVAQLDTNRFLVAGVHCRIDFEVADASSGRQRLYLRVEEGRYVDDVFQCRRWWNGDQTDWGLNFQTQDIVLHATLGTY